MAERRDAERAADDERRQVPADDVREVRGGAVDAEAQEGPCQLQLADEGWAGTSRSETAMPPWSARERIAGQQDSTRPHPISAAAIPAAALSNRGENIADRKEREVAASAQSAHWPPPCSRRIVRISESVARTGAKSGRAKNREMGQASTHKKGRQANADAVEIQNTVDSSSGGGFWCRIRARSQARIGQHARQKNERHRKADKTESFRARAGGPRSEAREAEGRSAPH